MKLRNLVVGVPTALFVVAVALLPFAWMGFLVWAIYTLVNHFTS